MTEWSCKKCGKTRDTVGQIESHLKRVHGLDESQYLSDHYEAVEIDEEPPGKPSFLGDYA